MATANAAKVAVEIGAAFAGSFNSVFASADSRVKGLGSTVSALDNKLGAIKGFQKARQAAIDAEGAWRQADEKLRDMGRSMAATGTVSEKQAREFKALQKQTEGLRKEMDRAQGNADKLETELKQAGVATNDLSATQAKLQRELERSTNRMKAMAMVAKADVGGALRGVGSEARRQFTHLAVGATAAAGGIFALAKSTSDLGDDVAKTAGRLGIGIREIQVLRYTAERGGMAASEMDGALTKFTATLGAARMGSKGASDELAKLGLNAQQLSKMPADKALQLVADRLERVQNHSEKAAIATTLFGKAAGTKMINVLAGGSAALQQLADDAEATGYILSEQAARDAETFNDTMLDSQLAIMGLKNTFGSALMPVVTEVMVKFNAFVRENRDQVRLWASDFANGLASFLPKLGDVARDLGSLLSGVRDVTTAVAGMVGGWRNLGIILVGLKIAPLILAIGKLGLALALATKGLLLFVTATGSTGAALGVLGVGFKVFALTAITSIKAVALALLANPIGLIIAGVAAAVVGAGYLIWKNWEAVKTGMTAIFTTIRDVAVAAFDGLKASVGAVIDWLASKTAWIFETVGAIRSAASSVGDGIGSAWQGAKNFVGLGGSSESPSGMPAPPPGAQVPAVAAGRNAPSVVQSNQSEYNVTIQGGSDPEATARAVRAELDRRDRENAARSRGRMTDAMGY